LPRVQWRPALARYLAKPALGQQNGPGNTVSGRERACVADHARGVNWPFLSLRRRSAASPSSFDKLRLDAEDGRITCRWRQVHWRSLAISPRYSTARSWPRRSPFAVDDYQQHTNRYMRRGPPPIRELGAGRLKPRSVAYRLTGLRPRGSARSVRPFPHLERRTPTPMRAHSSIPSLSTVFRNEQLVELCLDLSQEDADIFRFGTA
jgi:hypothetical protein